MKFYEFLMFWARNSRIPRNSRLTSSRLTSSLGFLDKFWNSLEAFCVYRLGILEFPKRHPLTPRKSRIPRIKSRIPKQEF